MPSRRLLLLPITLANPLSLTVDDGIIDDSCRDCSFEIQPDDTYKVKCKPGFTESCEADVIFLDTIAKIKIHTNFIIMVSSVSARPLKPPWLKTP